MFFVFVISIIVAAELELFVEWGTKLNYKAVMHLRQPAEVMSVTATSVYLVFLGLLVFQTGFAKWLHVRLLKKRTLLTYTRWPYRLVFILLVPGLLIVMIRGGLQQIPMNQSSAYFSKSNVLNNAAVNSAWNLSFNLIKNRKYADGNPFKFYDTNIATAVLKGIYDFPADSTEQVLITKRPNVVFVILEGWSSDLIKPLGGYDSITPFFNELSEEGLLFTNIYSAGLRSHEGMAAIFSGYPALPLSSFTHDPSKYQTVPVLNQSFSAEAYHTFYGFGGELTYGNIKSYLMQAGLIKLFEGSDFDATIPRAKLGVHDEYAFDRFLKEIDALHTPFFASWFTASSHAPYDIRKNIPLISMARK